jgi:radical SAM protein with 4Fe4S-binding SPASM domain
MFDEAYEQRLHQELGLEDWKKILFDYQEFLRYTKKKGFVVFTGGDPLLSPYLFDLIEFTQSMGMDYAILGNPGSDVSLLERLQQTRIRFFQVSLDGLEQTHDTIRGKGDFHQTLEFINAVTGTFDIRTQVMFTLTTQNQHEFIPLVRLLEEQTLLNQIAFTRLCPMGKGAGIQELQISTVDYQRFLTDVVRLHRDLIRSQSMLRIIQEESELFALMHYKLGVYRHRLFKQMHQRIYFGCYAGATSMSILSNGSAMACRRLLDSVFAHHPDNLFESFLSASELKPFQNRLFWDGCEECPLKHFCCGCPAVKQEQEPLEAMDRNCFMYSEKAD